MEFLLAVLAIRFLVNALTGNRNSNEAIEANSNELVYHPAEYRLR
jgi:hypothetical protein